MLRYSLRVLPLPVFAAALAAIAGLLWLADRNIYHEWPLVGLAVGAIGAAAGYLFDEPAAAVVDTLPRSLRWRTAARLIPAGVLAAAWIGGLGATDVGLAGRIGVVRLEGVGAILAASGAATVLRRSRVPAPGFTVGGPLLLVTALFAVASPLHRQIPLFELGPDGDWAASRALWTAIALSGAAALVTACCAPRLASLHR
jgi:hypothetical protein